MKDEELNLRKVFGACIVLLQGKRIHSFLTHMSRYVLTCDSRCYGLAAVC